MANEKMNYKWVEDIITKTQWKNHHSHISSYTFLEEVDGGIKIGYPVAHDPEKGIISNTPEITDEEYLRRIDLHRRATNTRPFPLETPEEKAERLALKEDEENKKHVKEYLEYEKEKLREINIEEIPF
jgi:hypothetical protein